MVVPISKFVNVTVSTAQQGVVPKDFRTPVFISDKVQFLDATKKFSTFSSAADMKGVLTYNGNALAEDSDVYIAALKLTANGLNNFIVADITTATENGATVNKISDSLDALKLSIDFFYIISSYRDEDTVTKIAEWAESNEVKFFTSTSDVKAKNTKYNPTASANDSIADKLHRSGFENTTVIYSAESNKFPEAAWVGERAIFTPGEAIWAYADLSGIAPDNLTPGEYDNLVSKKCNAFISVSGKRITSPGTVASGEWVDKIIERYYVKSRVQEEIFDLITSKRKIPFTEAGIALVASRFDKILDSLTLNILDQYAITVPRLADLTPTQIQSRKIAMKAKARQKGAIQTADFDIELTVGDING